MAFLTTSLRRSHLGVLLLICWALQLPLLLRTMPQAFCIPSFISVQGREGLRISIFVCCTLNNWTYSKNYDPQNSSVSNYWSIWMCKNSQQLHREEQGQLYYIWAPTLGVLANFQFLFSFLFEYFSLCDFQWLSFFVSLNLSPSFLKLLVITSSVPSTNIPVLTQPWSLNWAHVKYKWS